MQAFCGHVVLIPIGVVQRVYTRRFSATWGMDKAALTNINAHMIDRTPARRFEEHCVATLQLVARDVLALAAEHRGSCSGQCYFSFTAKQINHESAAIESITRVVTSPLITGTNQLMCPIYYSVGRF